MRNAPSNSDNVIDSRDVIKRIEELEYERDQLSDDEHEAWNESEEGQELKALTDLADEASSSPDWTYGETLIRDSYFEDYARELAYDIGAIGKDRQWPLCHIDWDAAADALKQDYTSVDFDGTDYWIRS